MKRLRLGLLALVVFASFSAQAVEDKLHVTAEEKIACTKDVVRLCLYTYPDEDKMLDCMKQNIPQLTPICRVAFVAGLKRRHLR